MAELGPPILILIATVSFFFLVGATLNRAHVKRWQKRAQATGQATCRDCGHVGPLSYGFLSGKGVTSANIRFICDECESENWVLPGGKRNPHRKRPRKRKG